MHSKGPQRRHCGTARISLIPDLTWRGRGGGGKSIALVHRCASAGVLSDVVRWGKMGGGGCSSFSPV